MAVAALLERRADAGARRGFGVRRDRVLEIEDQAVGGERSRLARARGLEPGM